MVILCRVCGSVPVYCGDECSACIREHLGPGADEDQ